MLKRSVLFAALCLFGQLPLISAPLSPKVFYNNRILAKVQDKKISLLDVIKAMDLFLAQNNPSVLKSFDEKMAFYHQTWQYFLNQQIENELVLTEAKGLKITIPEGEVNEEVLNRFGPQVSKRLNELNISPDEAHLITERDMIVSRLVGSRATAKAFHDITPETVKIAYNDYLKKNPEQSKLKYAFISIRGPDTDEKEQCAQKAHLLLKDHSIADVVQKLKNDFSSLRISGSKEIEAEETKISPEHKKILARLAPDSLSAPIKQSSKSGEVLRVFHLADREEIKPESLDKMYDSLQNKLISDRATLERTKYINKLKEKYDVNEQSGTISIPADYVPFEIR